MFFQSILRVLSKRKIVAASCALDGAFRQRMGEGADLPPSWRVREPKCKASARSVLEFRQRGI